MLSQQEIEQVSYSGIGKIFQETLCFMNDKSGNTKLGKDYYFEPDDFYNDKIIVGIRVNAAQLNTNNLWIGGSNKFVIIRSDLPKFTLSIPNRKNEDQLRNFPLTDLAPQSWLFNPAKGKREVANNFYPFFIDDFRIEMSYVTWCDTGVVSSRFYIPFTFQLIKKSDLKKIL